MPNHSSRAQPTRNRGALSADRIFNSTSPIINKDIQSFLALCITNWPCYTEEEKKTIISKFPLQYRHFKLDDQGKLSCPVTATFVAEDRIIKANIATFQREVSDGYYAKTWQEKARRAMQERAEGRFDEYLRSHAEELFGDDDNDDNPDEGDLTNSDGDFKARGGKRERREQSKSARKGKKTANENRGRMIAADLDMEDAA